MINFLRIVNRIKIGDYLHSDGTIDDNPSNDIIGVCVIPGDFLPDKFARFVSLKKITNTWNDRLKLNTKYKEKLPNIKLKGVNWGYLSSDENQYSLVSPYLPDGSFNPDFLIDLPHGNAFQDYKGYENTKKYKKNYGDSEELCNAFSSCFKISPSYRKSEWYLPAIGELALLSEKRSFINPKIMSAIRAKSEGSFVLTSFYWSSSECNSKCVWSVNMKDDSVDYFNKSYGSFIRAFLAL